MPSRLRARGVGNDSTRSFVANFLVVDFDAQGRIIPGSVDTLVSGAYAATAANVAKAWNVPENQLAATAFAEGTKALSLAIAQSPAFSLAGGGDTLAAIAKYGISDKVSYISTGGGAFLEFLEGKTLPAVEILEQRASA